MRKAVKLWTEAAELGSIEALFNLGDALLPSSTKKRPCRDTLVIRMTREKESNRTW